jgi:hypothetical protein
MSEDNLDMAEGADLPDNPGPNALGHTPLIGSARRSNDLPVLRDEVSDAVDGLDAVDLPDKPILPILSTK